MVINSLSFCLFTKSLSLFVKGSFATFKILSLSLNFDNVIIICLAVALFEFNLLGVL